MRQLDDLNGIAGKYFAVAKKHASEYAQMREEAWDQIPGFKKTSSPKERAAAYAERADQLKSAKLELDPKKKTGGTSLKSAVKLTTAEGKERANFKYEVDAFARQDAATKLSLKIDDPVVPVVARQLERDGATYDGWLKSNIPDDEKLHPDTSKWTRAQIREVMIGAVFSELLGNYDTKADQWATKGGHAINADTDQATEQENLDDLDARELTRHTHGIQGAPALPAMPPAVNLVYLDYVRGDLELDDADFGAMFDVIARIQSIPDAEFKALFEETVKSPAEREKMLLRRDTLHLEFADLIEDLKGEKGARENGTLGLFTRARLWVQDKKLLALAHYADSKWMERINGLSQKLTAIVSPPKPVAVAE
jgi:hypothetical protein